MRAPAAQPRRARHGNRRTAAIRLGNAVLRVLCAAAVPAPFIGHQSAASKDLASMQAARVEMRALLERVGRWGCQYQNIDVQSIAASSLDLIVVEPIIDPATGRLASTEEMRLLKMKGDGKRRLVLAYLSVGAAEEYRPYWSADWKAGPSPPWLGAESREWPRSYSVRYWHPEWRDIVMQASVRLADSGFDGVFLDRVDAFQDWHKMRASALDDMAELIRAIADAVRSRNPAFLLVAQNAEPLLASPRYLETIDAVSKESLLTGLRGHEIPNSTEDITWSLGYLRLAQKEGLKILAIEYLNDASLIAAAAAQYAKLGFVPFFGDRLLDRLP
jgi:cysteinyl-tRNA synthetase, unknown class